MNTIENNKIIAEFMGLPMINDEGQINFIKGLKHTPDYELRYHKNWNWLMEVVEKCLIGEAEHYDEKANKAISEIYESLCNINISATYKSVVEFIKWHNEQK